jgi:tripartite motif-containing protein 71
VLGAPASRRSVLGALLAAVFVPRLPATGAVLGQRETCPCPDPPCFLSTWGRDLGAPGQFREPAGVAVAPDGTVYVVDSGNHRIQYFDSTGTYLGQWGRQGNRQGSGDGEFNTPFGVAVAPDGTVYVTDTLNYRVQAFDNSGTFLGTWGREGSADGEFNTPMGVAVAPDGTVYIVDAGNYRIQYFDTAGAYLGQWGSPGTAAGMFSGPIGVAVASDGTVYVADISMMEEGDSRIQLFDAAGAYLAQLSGDMGLPTAVAVAPGGTVYVTDPGNSRIQFFDAAGTLQGQ